MKTHVEIQNGALTQTFVCVLSGGFTAPFGRVFQPVRAKGDALSDPGASAGDSIMYPNHEDGVIPAFLCGDFEVCGDPLFGIEVVGDIKPAESFSGHEHSLRLTLDRSCDPHHVRGVLYRVAPWP
jgi:hypothetical protein